MRSIKSNSPIGRFQHLANGSPIPIEGDITVPIEAWRIHMESLSWREGKTGVRIDSASKEPEEIPGLSRLAAVVLDVGTPDAPVCDVADQARKLRGNSYFRGALIVRGNLASDAFDLLEHAGVDLLEDAGNLPQQRPS